MKEIYKVELTAEECVGIQNLLEQVRSKVGIVSAMKEIDYLIEKFRNPISLQD